MRHLKLFEEIVDLYVDFSKYKKYILSFEDNVYYVDEIIDVNSINFVLFCYYTYNINSGYGEYKNKEIRYEKEYFIKYLNECVIYTSDSLEDCIRMIEINKYNL